MERVKKVSNLLALIHSSKTVIFQPKLVFTLKNKKIKKSNTKFSDERKLLNYQSI